MKAIFINGSPRRNQNTFKLIDAARRGAESVGAETEIVQLFSIEYTGCKSCFACKLKNAKTNGLCAIHDSLRPILEKCLAADAIVIGSPVYFHYPTGQVRSLIERLLFPLLSYSADEDGNSLKIRDKIVPSAMIYTMNCPEDYMKEVDYPTILGATVESFNYVLGYGEVLYSCDTYQFSNYDRYEANRFDEAHKREHRDKQFPIDIEKAFELGARLIEKAGELNGSN